MSGYDYWDINTGEGLTEYELTERYRDLLGEVYGDVEIAGLTYSVARALEAVDPIAFRVGFSDWLDSELGETITEDEPEDAEE